MIAGGPADAGSPFFQGYSRIKLHSRTHSIVLEANALGKCAIGRNGDAPLGSIDVLIALARASLGGCA
jgi:hypothetical protein